VNGASIGIGILLLFALLFNGGLGHPFFTMSAISAGLLLLLAGVLPLIDGQQSAGYWSYILAGVAYVPVIVQRFGPGFIDIVGLVFDVFIGWFIFSMVRTSKPNQSNKAQPPAAGTH